MCLESPQGGDFFFPTVTFMATEDLKETSGLGSTVLSCEQDSASLFTPRGKTRVAHTCRTEWLPDKGLFPLSNILMLFVHLFVVVTGYFPGI